MHQTSTGFRRDRYTVFLYVLLAIFGFKQAVLGSVMPFVRDELGFSTAQIGWHFSVYALGLILSGQLVQALGRSLEHGRLLRLAAIAMVAAILLVAVVDALWSTLLVSLLLGATGGTVQIAIQSGLAEHHGRNQGVALVEAFVLAALGVFLGPLAIGHAAEAGLGWRAGLIVPALLLAATFLVFRGAAGSPPVRAAAAAEDPSATGGRLPLAVLLVLGMVLLGIATEWGIGFWGAQFLEARLALEPGQAVTMMSVFFGGTVAGRIAASRLLRVFEVRTMLIALILLGGSAVATLALSQSTTVAWIALFVGGACLGNFFPLILSVANEIAPNRPTDVSRGATQAVGLALLIVPFVIGQLGESLGLTTAVGLLAFLPLGMLALLFAAKATRERAGAR